jgi:two-component system sensor histidine kinase NreB
VNRTQDIARSVHDLSHRLHPAKLRLIGLVPALQSLQRELSRSDSSIVLHHENVPANLSPNLTLSLFRIVQEALQNALKYSQAGTIAVLLRGSSKDLTLTITDDGIGFDVDASVGKGLGLISIDERIEAIGGTLDIRSEAGVGSTLTIVVPIRPEHPADSATAASGTSAKVSAVPILHSPGHERTVS